MKQRFPFRGAALFGGLFAVASLFLSAAEKTPPDRPAAGYVLLKDEEARLARVGNLFRVFIREVTRRDGSKAKVYRDIDYPIREKPADPATETPKKKSADADDDVSESNSNAGEPAHPPVATQVWAFLGPEYEDPPAPGSSPSPNRLRRPGPSLVTYEFDAYALTEGKRDEYLRIEFDFSGTHPTIRGGHWSMENEAGDIKPPKEPGADFLCEQGAYGEAAGTLETANLHEGIPEVMAVRLTRKSEPAPMDLTEERPKLTEGTGSYRLKRKSLEVK